MATRISADGKGKAPKKPGRAGKRTPAPLPPVAPDETLHRALAKQNHIIEIKAHPPILPSAARAAGGAPTVPRAQHQDDVVEVALQNGARFFTRFDQFVADYGGPAARGAGADDQFVIPTALTGPSADRGVGEFLIKSFSLLGINPVGAAAELTGKQVCAWYEARQLQQMPNGDPGGQRLWRASTGDSFGLTEAGAIDPKGQPLLIFLHGTASSSRGSFGELWASGAKDIREALFAPYKGNVFAFEHFSMTQSPMQNALELIGALPDGARLHLISHSRGGLIGELLCRGQAIGRDPIADDEIAGLFGGKDYEEESRQLRALNELLKRKKLRIERFVRVACPARGTILASERIDHWLSISLDVVGMVGDLVTSGFFEVFEEFVKALVKTRTKPGELPGLESMMPTAPIVRLLNRANVKTSADLHVIAGDIEGSGIWQRLGVLFTDLYYREDHDLVVNTRAMYGGTPRSDPPRRIFTQGPNVSHFNYFRNRDTASRVVDALQKPALQDGFDVFDQQASAGPDRGYRLPAPEARGITASTKPIAILLPGVMGSTLDVSGERIWLDIEALGDGGLERLGIDAAGVTASGVVESAYGEFIEFLGKTHDVVPFPFDWRLSVRREAARLAEAVKTWLAEAQRREQPLVLVAHSMGGLVARIMIADHPELWTQLVKHPQGRLLMLGTPNGGAHVITLMLLGREPIVQALALIDCKHSQRELLQIIGRFPGAMELLPAHDTLDFLDPKSWKTLEDIDEGNVYWDPPDAQTLQGAKTVRDLLGRSMPDIDRVLYVAGKAPRTPFKLHLEPPPASGNPDNPKWPSTGNNFYFEEVPEGDGRVPWSTGILPGQRVWYMDAVHGDLAATSEYFGALVDLIQTGDTDKLPHIAPKCASRGAEPAVHQPKRLEFLPDMPALESVVTGGGPRRRRAGAGGKKVQASVMHGDLAFAANAVFVGHYAGDAIDSAEKYIDGQLGGRLTAHNRLGLYPGELNSAAVFLGQQGGTLPRIDFAGAVVMGLGSVGSLTPSMLTTTFMHAAVTYAAEWLDRFGSQSPAQVELAIESLLIGTGWNAMAVRDSVTAVLRAVVRANELLDRVYDKGRVRIANVVFVELYEDTAILAARALRIAQGEPELASRIAADPRLITKDGSKRRAYFADSGQWWHRLQITESADQCLKFTMLTDRARAESVLQPTQRALVDKFISRQITTTDTDVQLEVTLFELLVPLQLKQHAPEGRDLVLVLDAAAAHYPWEMMRDSVGGADGVGESNVDAAQTRLALRAGLIRQLETQTFREVVTTATAKTALVVGNPESNPTFADLPGARHEAEVVAGVLDRSDFAVTRLYEPKPGAPDIVSALFARPYRILHLAGHGVYNFELPLTAEESARKAAGETVKPRLVTGMVIGDGIYLTPAEVKQMRQVPEIVFINCCHLGRVDSSEDVPTRDRHLLAANLATEFIRMGVKVVVAAGWAVDDEAAALFAKTFYEQMVSGTTFGSAVHRARTVAARDCPGRNTWGAYQCYGDYDFRLDIAAHRARTSPADEFVSPVELVMALENIANDAKTASDAKRDQLHTAVDALVKAARATSAEWLKSGRVAAAIARAYGELECFDDAVAYYETALQASAADFPLSAVEQCVNLAARAAYKRIFGAHDGQTAARARRDAIRVIETAIGRISRLIEIGPTDERHSIKGGAYKRLALMREAKGLRKSALRSMRDSYGAAHILAQGNTGKIKLYPYLNWLVARACLRVLGDKDEKLAEDLVLLTHLAAAYSSVEALEFWDLVNFVDIRLTGLLLSGTITDADAQELAQLYLRVRSRAGSSREVASVRDHLDFIAEIYGQSGAGATKDIAKRIRSLADNLREAASGGPEAASRAA